MNLAASHLYPEKEGTYIEGEMVRDVPQEELLAHFEGWEEDARQLCQVRDTAYIFHYVNLSWALVYGETQQVGCERAE